MPRYYFDLTIDGETTLDRQGFDLTDRDDAAAKCRAILDATARERPGCTVTVQMRDEDGTVLHADVSFSAA